MHHRGIARRLLLLAVAVAGIGGCAQPTSTVHATLAPDTPAPATPTPTATPPTATPTLLPLPTETGAASPGTPACLIEDIKASRGITVVDADDRVTEVVLVAAATCSVDAWPTLLLEDANQNILVAANAAGTGGIDLVEGVAYTSEVRLANWCLGDPAYPVSIGILEGIQTLLVTGDSFPDQGDLPPCVHQDADPVLSGTAWTPKS
jgi:hypothetical protein